MSLIRARLSRVGTPITTYSFIAGPWVLPTLNEDGSPIGTITDQTVYYDTVSQMGTGVDYASSVAVGNGTSLTKLITGLLGPATTYYYATTVTVAGVESNYGVESSGVSA